VLTLCQFLLELTRRPIRASPTRSSVASEEDAIREMYFSRETFDIDPALVERLLWWEGVAVPLAAEDRMRAKSVAA
jgi:hypothetical protein